MAIVLRTRRHFSRWDLLGSLAVVVCLAAIAWISVNREYFNIWTETDFLGAFLPDAQRFQRNEGMLLEYHPPAYSIVVGALEYIVGDWLTTGLLISWVAAAITLTTSYVLYRRLGGPCAGLGSLVALLSSMVFLSYSAQSTSDLMFLAVFYGALTAVIAAMESGRLWLWALAGLLVAVGMLSRTNGVVLAILLFAPLATGPRITRLRSLAVMLVAMVIPILLWISYASATNSPLMPTNNTTNFAMRYVSLKSTTPGDKMIELEGRFDSIWDVVKSDPIHIARTYLYDLVLIPLHAWRTALLWKPLVAVGGLASLLWLARWRDPRIAVVLLPTIASVLLLNMKDFESRFYLLLVPLFGASSGLAFQVALSRLEKRLDVQKALVVLVGIFSLGIFASAIPKAIVDAERPAVRTQLEEAVPFVSAHTPQDAFIVVRKGNIAFHANRRMIFMLDSANAEEFCEGLQQQSVRPLYIFAGIAEHELRAALIDSLSSSGSLPWLKLVGQGTAGGPWLLWEFVPGRGCVE